MINLILGLVVMAICLLLQSGLMVLAMRHYARNQRFLESTTFGTSLVLVSSVMFLLVLGNLAQIIIWAALFQSLGEFTDFRAAIYHSAVNFATLGYGDITPTTPNSRVLSALEAVTGTLYLAVFISTLVSTFRKR